MGRRQKTKTKHSRRAAIEQATRAAVKTESPQINEIALPRAEKPSLQKGLTTLRSVGIIVLVGIATFALSLRNKFQGDDNIQILNNPVVHSISHFALFFRGSAFYYGNGLTPLSGSYFRPLMTTAFSLLYTLFGPDAFYFHLFQMALFIGSVCLLFAILKRPFSTILALLLSLLFLVHPLNTQVVYAIPSLQDTLLFFFGLLGFYILTTYSSIKSLIFVVLSLFLSLLAKETGLCFAVMSGIYLFWWDRKRLYPFLSIFVAPLILYIVLRTYALGGILPHIDAKVAPIESLNVVGRLFTMPEVILFYVWNFIFPWHIASEYMWVQPHYSTSRFLVPLIVDLLLIAFIADRAIELKKKADDDAFKMFLFFAVWTAIGLIPYLQIIPIDGSTVNDAWFLVSMVGVMGMIGAYLTAYQVKMKYVLSVSVVLILVFGVYSAIRALAWDTDYTLAKADVPNSPTDYSGLSNLADYYSNRHQYKIAITDLNRSIKIQPLYSSLYDLGVNQSLVGEYSQAEVSYARSLKLDPPKQSYQQIDENVCLTASFTGNKNSDVGVCQLGVNHFPHDALLWVYLAFVEQRFGDNYTAIGYLKTAEHYGNVPKVWVDEINDNKPITVNFLYSGEDKTIYN